MFDRDIVFVDTETLGLDRDAPVWEFAAIRITGGRSRAGGIDRFRSFLIDHNPGDWLATLPESFQADYQARYVPELAVRRDAAAARVSRITDNAIVAGSNPSFDIERLEILLRREGLEPGWHHHPLDIPSMIAGQMALAGRIHTGTAAVPWRSEEMSNRIGVDPAQFDRHTAWGDVKWCLAQWRAMTGQGSTDA